VRGVDSPRSSQQWQSSARTLAASPLWAEARALLDAADRLFHDWKQGRPEPWAGWEAQLAADREVARKHIASGFAYFDDFKLYDPATAGKVGKADRELGRARSGRLSESDQAKAERASDKWLAGAIWHSVRACVNSYSAGAAHFGVLMARNGILEPVPTDPEGVAVIEMARRLTQSKRGSPSPLRWCPYCGELIEDPDNRGKVYCNRQHKEADHQRKLRRDRLAAREALEATP
jgi:hypothetical protein